MKLIDARSTKNRFPQPFYPRIPELHMIGDGNEATNLARLIVNLAVDYRRAYAVRTRAETYPTGLYRAWQLRRSAKNGFEATANFADRQQEANRTEVYVVQNPSGDIGMQTLTHGTQGFQDAHDLYWIRDERGAYLPHTSLLQEGRAETVGPDVLVPYAAHYAVLAEQINDPEAFIPLSMSYATINPIDLPRLPSEQRRRTDDQR